MNKKERKVSEIEIRNDISHKEEKLKRIATEEIKVMIGILEDAVKSQDPKVLIKGLNYYQVILVTMAVLEIKYDKIGSSEEKLISLTDKIFERLPIKVKLDITARVEDKDEKPATGIFVNNPTWS